LFKRPRKKWEAVEKPGKFRPRLPFPKGLGTRKKSTSPAGEIEASDPAGYGWF
jgi:hypothetical protein